MYIHKQKLQHVSSPEKPDAVYARKLQEVIGGQYGGACQLVCVSGVVTGRG